MCIRDSQLSSPVSEITNLAYQYVFSDEEPHLVTWDDNNYGYEVALTKLGGKTIISSYTTYESSQIIGFLPAADYSISVKGFSSTLEYGVAKKLTLTVTAPPTPPEEPTITNEDGVITLTPPRVEKTSSYYEFKYHSENVITAAKDYSNGDTITLYAQRKDQEFNIWYRLASKEGFGSWVHKEVIANAAFSTDLDAAYDELLNRENTDWGGSLSQKIATITADLQTWSTQTGSLGETYDTLLYNVTQVEAANQVNSLDIIAIRGKVGDKTVQAQISEFKNAQIGYEDAQGNWVEGAAFAQAFNEIKINSSERGQLSVFSYFEAIETALGELEGEIQFAIDDNGRMTGIKIQGGNNVSAIRFVSENLIIEGSDGKVWQEWDNVAGVVKSYATIYAENIEGDITDGRVLDLQPIVFDGSGTPTPLHDLLKLRIPAQPFERLAYIHPVPIQWGDLDSMYISATANNSSTLVLSEPMDVFKGDSISGTTVKIPKDTMVEIDLRVNANDNNGTAIIDNDILVQLFKQADSIVDTIVDVGAVG